ncbi:PREDICTED: melanoma-associated antigen B4-like [Chrysochloris asiatica]|uniref:Melanoma-associated antigen B4-like n=1 Tax=Chrysochloris asiatica TaxID=185453 RepID=A0A9B0TA86_CHRAS|nr:PREDICTED: melanoma-associated antigen B4-like [Chrysochloris asiatica]
MPRRQKNKSRNREKHPPGPGDAHDSRGAQATAAVDKEPLSNSSACPSDTTQGSAAVDSCSIPKRSQRPQSTTTTYVANSCRRLDEGVNRENEEHCCISETECCIPDPLTIKADLLEQFLIYKYKMKQPIYMADMLKVISRKYKDHFPEIFQIVSERIETMFAVDVKEIDSTTKSYALVSKLNLPNKGRVRAGIGLPKTSLLMTLLGVILLNGNCTPEKEIWEFLNKMHIFAGRKHFIYGEPRQLITKDFVRLNFLEYRQIPNSDPPCYEFLWGPKAHAETSKVKIFEYLAKVNGILPSSLEALYEEAMRDEEGRA